MRHSAILAMCLVSALSGVAAAQNSPAPPGKAASAGAARSGVVSFVADGTQIRVPVPKDYCGLDPSRLNEAAWIAATQANGYDVGVVDCVTLESARLSGDEIMAARHISIRFLSNPELRGLDLATGCAASRESVGEVPFEATSDWRDLLLETSLKENSATVVIGETEQACMAASAYNDTGIAIEAYTVVQGKWLEIYSIDEDRQLPDGLATQYRQMIRVVAHIQAAN